MLSRLVIAFLPRSKTLLISWLQSPSAVILEPKKINTSVGIHYCVSVVSELENKTSAREAQVLQCAKTVEAAVDANGLPVSRGLLMLLLLAVHIELRGKNVFHLFLSFTF